MPKIVKLGEKLTKVGQLNGANNWPSPRSKTELAGWFNLPVNTLSRYYLPNADLGLSLERAFVMALGFGPSDADFEELADLAWTRWLATVGDLWRRGEPEALAERLAEVSKFVARLPDDPGLTAQVAKAVARRRGKVVALGDPMPTTLPIARDDRNYLDRLASFTVTSICETDCRHRLMAQYSFNSIEVPTDEATYVVSINRCEAEIYLESGSFESVLDSDTLVSTSRPIRRMEIARQYRRHNYPTWILRDELPKTVLKGEYFDIVLGRVTGDIDPRDEASLIVHKAGFGVFAAGGGEIEGGALNSLLKFLVTEHVGEIEQSGSYLYRLSMGPIVPSEAQ